MVRRRVKSLLKDGENLVQWLKLRTLMTQVFKIINVYLVLSFFMVSCASSNKKLDVPADASVKAPSPVDPSNPPQIRIDGLKPDSQYQKGSLIKVFVANYPTGQSWQGFELVINDGEPERFYESQIDYKLPVKKLRKGANLLKAYLVRSWGESLKNKEAFAYVPFFYDGGGLSWVAPGRPIVTILSPRGEYKGEDAKKILFDFVVHTAGEKQKNWKVHYNLNGSKLELSAGKAYYFYELVPGEYDLKVEAVNSRGIPLGQEVSRSSTSFKILAAPKVEKNP